MTAKPPAGKYLKILEAACLVFAERGYHRSTISDIAQRAGVAAGTIYTYVRRKEELLGLLFRELVGGYLSSSSPLLDQAEPGFERLAQFVHLYFEFFSGQPELARVFQIHLREVDPALREEIGPTVKEFFATVEGVIESGVTAGEFDPDLDRRVARHLIFGSLDASLTAWVLAPDKTPLDQIEAAIVPLIARGLRRSEP